jgi:hypothetical protein
MIHKFQMMFETADYNRLIKAKLKLKKRNPDKRIGWAELMLEGAKRI